MLVVVLLIYFKSNAKQKIPSGEKLIFSEKFTGNLDKKRWISEIELVEKSSILGLYERRQADYGYCWRGNGLV